MSDGLNQNQAQLDAAPMESTPVKQEQMVPQSEVDKLAVALKYKADEAYLKGKQEAEAAYQRAQQSNNFGAQQVAQGALTEEQVRKIAAEQNLRMQQQQAEQMFAEKVVNEFFGKMAQGPEIYPDFKETVETLNLKKLTDIVQLANSVDNTADVMYELARNPEKIAMLKGLVNEEQFTSAKIAIDKLSNSIKANKKATAQVDTTRQPLEQMKPSVTAKVDNGPMTLKEMKRQSWARG